MSDASDAFEGSEAADTREVVFLEDGGLPEQADAALKAARHAGALLLKSGGELVTVGEETTTTNDHVARPARKPRRLRLSPVSLQEILTRHVRFMKWDGRRQDFKHVDCPLRLAAALVERGTWPEVPELVGFVCAPTLRADGIAITRPGYDATSGLYVVDWGLGSIDLPGANE